MKLISIKYFIKEGFNNVWVNGIMSIASILVILCCMVLTGSAVLMSANISYTLKSIEGKNSITVYLEKEIKPAQALKVGEKISEIPNVLSCEYYSREEAADKYKDMMGDFFNSLQGEKNPFPDAFHITMEDLSKYEETVGKIKAVEGVKSISDRSETAKKLTELNNMVASAGFWIVVSLGVVSLFIISNTIRIAIYNRRFEINIMKSIGATNWFIRAPFIVEGITIGLISALLSTAVLKFVYAETISIINKIIPFKGLEFNELIGPVFLGFIVAGVLFGLIGGVISVSKYLRKEGGDVVAW